MAFNIGDKVRITRGAFEDRTGKIVEPTGEYYDDAVRYTVAIDGGPNHLQYVAESLERYFEAGDYVKVIGLAPFCDEDESKIGQVFKVTHVEDWGNGAVCSTTNDDIYYHAEQLELSTEPLPKAKVGDQVQITGPSWTGDPVHMWKSGTVNLAEDTDGDYHIAFNVGGGNYFKRDSFDVIPAPEAGPLEGKGIADIAEMINARFESDPASLIRLARFLLVDAQDSIPSESAF